MPRYNYVDVVSFTNEQGNVYTVKTVRPLQDLTTAFIIDIQEQDQLDEIASRPEIFGENNEDLSYIISDHNIEKLVENNFDLSTIKTLNIPIIEET